MEIRDLEDIVKRSNTLTEVLKSLGLRAAGGNFESLKRKLKSHGIDYSHFNPDKVRIDKLKSQTAGRKFELSDCLKEGSTYGRGSLKRRLYDEGLKSRVCELCGQGEEWHGQRMSLILDHINGVWDDNRLCNLRIVCPNCNATLPTHCGKNKVKECEVNHISGHSEAKIKSYESRRVVSRPEYQVLIVEVLENGYSATGRKYGVSDTAIRKWIKYYEKNKTT